MVRGLVSSIVFVSLHKKVTPHCLPSPEYSRQTAGVPHDGPASYPGGSNLSYLTSLLKSTPLGLHVTLHLLNQAPSSSRAKHHETNVLDKILKDVNPIMAMPGKTNFDFAHEGVQPLPPLWSLF